MKVALVSCSSSKLSYPSKARDLYSSPLYLASRTFVEGRYNKWYILSAKYGLLEPDQNIEPYDETLNKKSMVLRKAWASEVATSLVKLLPKHSVIDIYAGASYFQLLRPLLEEQGFVVRVPLEGVSLGFRIPWFRNSTTSDADSFYRSVDKLRQGGAVVPFDQLAKAHLPEKGLYLFFEPGENRRESIIPRVTRVGTHGVSLGSKSTLWHRLKTHLGTQSGGNHRSSIFRLHVGAALIAKNNFVCDSWGIGQVADRQTVDQEQAVEMAVSSYMRQLHVGWLSIPDDSSSKSDRAVLEASIIGFLSGKQAPLDPPSPDWLGLYSPKETIKSSGMWNLKAMHSNPQPGFLDMLEYFVDVTLGNYATPSKSMAPYFCKELPPSNSQFHLLMDDEEG